MHPQILTPNTFTDAQAINRLREMAASKLKLHAAGIQGVKDWAVAHDALLAALATPDLALGTLQEVMNAFWAAEEGMAASALYGHWQ